MSAKSGKMDSNTLSYSSVRTFDKPTNIRNETKEKFDALLKTAKNRKIARRTIKSASKEHLLNDEQSTTASSENLLDNKDVVENNKVENFELDTITDPSKNYILSKFFDQTTDSHNKEIISVEVQNENLNPRPPVPIPRKSKLNKNHSPTVSQGTFEVTSPKIVKNNDRSASSSNKTYNIAEDVGDVLIHNSAQQSKVKIKMDRKLKKSNNDLLNDENYSDTEAERENTPNSDLNKDESTHQISENDKVNVESADFVTGTKPHKKQKIQKNETASISDETVQSQKKHYAYEKIVEIIIHKTDRLQLNSLVVHPVVKIHIVDISTGKYFPKSDQNRSVVFFYENKDYDYISPVMTHTYNLQEKRILFPSWEETILLNEDFEYFKDEGHRIILFFEVLDFVTSSDIHLSNQKDYAKGWHNIAFAFLKLCSKEKELNMGKKMRLQLYRIHQIKKSAPHMCNVWTWWKKKTLEKYPSSLYVTIKPVVSPTKVIETFRSKTPIQGETSSKAKLFEEIKKEVPDIGNAFLNCGKKENGADVMAPTWSRSSHETCKLPNKCMVKFDTCEDGCFVMKFSSNGHFLACAIRYRSLFFTVVFSVLSLKELHKFPSHQELIYDIKWSDDDSFLITASADNTISVFNILTYSLFQILPHPSFVYCCTINQEKHIASGCYDGIIRIWNYQVRVKERAEYNLFQELEGHKGYVTSLCFTKKSNILSADSLGVIIEWKKEAEDWIQQREITLLDLKETIINQILLFPKEKKLLVHARDSTIRIIDLKSGCVLQWLRGALNRRIQTFCAISPCGTFVYSGSEDGYVHVWNSKNGQEVACYLPYPQENQLLVIHCIDCHPFDNFIALSHYGKRLSILLYCYDKKLTKPEINVTLNILEEDNAVGGNKSGQFEKLKLKSVQKSKNFNVNNHDEKISLKGILQKMDEVITS